MCNKVFLFIIYKVLLSHYEKDEHFSLKKKGRDQKTYKLTKEKTSNNNRTVDRNVVCVCVCVVCQIIKG